MDVVFPFERSFSPIFGTIHRPVAQVFFYSKPKRRWYEIWMIADIGADYTILPKYFSERLGVDLAKECQVFITSGIGGDEKVYLAKHMRAKLGNWEREVPVGFLERDEAPPLLDRQLFLETFESFFRPTTRLHFLLQRA